ncbi:MAG: LysM peptidoglycan-binding domain-containing protein [Clostridia bacterium]|nr:LysM peptidoglycan-binding domain-containing protein [Clostridia bacterium]
MERNEEQKERVQLEFADRRVPLELTAEVTLPDYRSEISRLLWVRPCFLPPARFIGGGKADFSGACRYDILYTGPDGCLYSATEEGSYAFSLPLELPALFDGGAVELCAMPSADAVISRVVGPRRLSVRCRMHARVCGYADKALGVRMRGEGERGEEILRLCDLVESRRVVTGGSEQLDLADSFEMEGGEWRLAATCGEVFLPEVSVVQDGVLCRGEAVITLLCCREGDGGAPQSVVRRIPFEREVPLECGALPECRARAVGSVAEIRASIEEGRALLDVKVALATEAQGQEELALCRDVFLPGTVGETQYSEETLRRAGVCGNRNFSISEELGAGDIGLPEGATPLAVLADAEVKESAAGEGQTTLMGEMTCHILYYHQGEYGVAERSLPWRVSVDGCCEELLAEVTVPLCRVTPVREGWRIDAELQLSMRGACRAQVRVLSEVQFTQAQPPARADLEICYPAEGESLWEIGKRYGIAPEALALANGLSADAPASAESLSGVQYLLIP